MATSAFFKKLIKFLFVVFNVACLIFSLALIIVSGITLGQLHSDELNTKSNTIYLVLIYFVFILGVVLFVLAFIGCFGVMKKKPTLLFIYNILLIILMVIASFVSVVIFVTNSTMEDYDKQCYDRYHYKFEKNVKFQEGDAIKFINDTQESLQCCGVKSFMDYGQYFNKGNDKIFNLPASCCKEKKENCTSKADTLYVDGCGKKYVTHNKDDIKITGIVCICFVCCLIILPIATCITKRAMKKELKHAAQHPAPPPAS